VSPPEGGTPDGSAERNAQHHSPDRRDHRFMTKSAELLTDAFGRIREIVHDVLDGLTPAELTFCLDTEANSIAWLVWHLTRIQDDHVAAVAAQEQVWIAAGFAERFGLALDTRDTGYGHSSREVRAVTSTAEELRDYHDAVHEATVRFVEQVTDADLDRIVDTRWDPPVTLEVRLVSVIADDLEHAGQAAFIRGIVERM
jgi:uncharacterized damage-inducible protein DinB